jgi:zinc/manganese transport system substrate-binding protein
MLTSIKRLFTLSILPLAGCLALTGCGSALHSSGGKIRVLGAENEYGNVLAQIGGKYVSVSSIISNPNTDPHTFEASPSVAHQVEESQLIVQNGVGYDSFINGMEGASSNSHRQIINVQKLLGLPNTTPNPHLWYAPTTMPRVAQAIGKDLTRIDPSRGAYFRARVAQFEKSLQPWYHALSQFKKDFGGTAVATTEPVGDYMLEAAGTRNLTPFSTQADIMNGTDLAPQSVTLQQGLFTHHLVKVFVYNQQVTDSVTNTFRLEALHRGIPVVGVYETMPTPGYDYQTWMLAEVQALTRAVKDGISTQKLVP